MQKNKFNKTTPTPKQSKMIQDAVALHQTGQVDLAEIKYKKLLSVMPSNTNLLTNLGTIAFQKGDLEETVSLISRSLQINPNQTNALSNLGLALHELKRIEEALVNYDRAITLKPHYAEAHYNRGNALSELKRHGEAVESYDNAITIKPDYAEAYANRGVALKELKRFDEALLSYGDAIELRPHYADAYCNRGNALKELNRLDEALASYDRAIELKSNYAQAYWNKSLLKLLLGEYTEGWQLYEWRWQIFGRTPVRKFIEPLWLGNESLANKRIFIYSEQGLGDVIQFIRYVVKVEQLGAKVILEVPKILIGIVSTLECQCTLIDTGITSPEFDYQCPLMSLPLAFQTKLDSIPSQVPYLFPPADKINFWKNYIGDEGFKIGISWQGGWGKEWMERSFPLHLLEDISKIKGIRLISLQKSTGTDQLAVLPNGMSIEVLPDYFDNDGHAFLDSMAVMKCLDLVITCDTAITHLAGALNVKTWTALHYVPDFRWLLDRKDTPWYPKHRLFRQTIQNDWNTVFKVMENSLNRLIEEQ